MTGSAGLKTIIVVIGRSDLEEVCKDVERAMGVELEPRDSAYLGGAYYGAGKRGAEMITLSRNYISFIEDYLESERKDCPLVLKIHMTPRAEQFMRAIEQIPQASVVRVSPSATGP